MQPFLTRQQVRKLDRRAIEEYGVLGVVLMENAGRGAAELLISLGIHGRVLVCSGKGNNGGDGFVIARHLANRGIDVKTLVFAPAGELQGEALVNYQILKRGRYPLVDADAAFNVLENELARCEWVVDALFGTGLAGPIRPPFDAIVRSINASGARVLAVDIPSGLDCETGEPLGVTIKAAHTVTFVAPKIGFEKPPAASWLGCVHVADIGMPKILLEEA